MYAVFSSYGARLLELNVPDKRGHMTNVVVGFSDPDKYVEFKDDLIGATVGRLAGRVESSVFVRDDFTVSLTSNSQPHHIHGGGVEALDQVIWAVSDQSETEVTFTHISSHGINGYPGNLTVQARFSLTQDCSLLIEYSATTDCITPVNLTHHSYWNLSGTPNENLEQHYLRIAANETLETIDLFPSGEVIPVKGTDLDYSTLTPLAHRPWKELDHGFISNEPGVVAELWHPNTGIRLTLTSAQPVLQVYAGKFLGSTATLSNRAVSPGRGIALEPQCTNSSIAKRPDLQTKLLEPGMRYTNTMKFSFTIENELLSRSNLRAG